MSKCSFYLFSDFLKVPVCVFSLPLNFCLCCSYLFYESRLYYLLARDLSLEFNYKLLTIVHTSSQSSQSSLTYFTFDPIIEMLAVYFPRLDPNNTQFSISFFSRRWSVPISMWTVNNFSQLISFSSLKSAIFLFFINILLKLLFRVHFSRMLIPLSIQLQPLSSQWFFARIVIFCDYPFNSKPFLGKIDSFQEEVGSYSGLEISWPIVSIQQLMATVWFGFATVNAPFNDIPSRKTTLLLNFSYWIITRFTTCFLNIISFCNSLCRPSNNYGGIVQQLNSDYHSFSNNDVLFMESPQLLFDLVALGQNVLRSMQEVFVLIPQEHGPKIGFIFFHPADFEIRQQG